MTQTHHPSQINEKKLQDLLQKIRCAGEMPKLPDWMLQAMRFIRAMVTDLKQMPKQPVPRKFVRRLVINNSHAFSPISRSEQIFCLLSMPLKLWRRYKALPFWVPLAAPVLWILSDYAPPRSNAASQITRMLKPSYKMRHLRWSIQTSWRTHLQPWKRPPPAG